VGLIAHFTSKSWIVVEISVTITHALPRGGTDFMSPGELGMDVKESIKPHQYLVDTSFAGLFSGC
jgi:hypothetical protein